MGMNTAAVQRLYVAYFNRPADPVGLAVYEAMLPSDRVATQAELQVIAETYFSPSAEYTTNFSGKSNIQIVDQLYQNIFGRAAEVDGLIAWATKLTDGSITVAELALQLSYSAQGTDAAVVDARIEAAVSFTDGLDTSAKITGYSGDAAAAQGRAYLAQISGELPTTDEAVTAQKDTAITNVDTYIESAVNAGGSAAGTTYTLAAGFDSVVGTSSSDQVFAAITTAASTTTLDAGDQINLAGGTDTLNLTLSGGNYSGDALISNVETFSVSSSGGARSFDADGLEGVELFTNYKSAQDLTVTNLESVATGIGISKDTTANTTSVTWKNVALAGTDDTVALQLSGVAAAEVISLRSAGTNGIENVTIASNGSTENFMGAFTVQNSAGTATMSSLTITGSANLDMDASPLEFAGAATTASATFDASAMTGRVKVDLDETTNLRMTASSGSGNDTFDFGDSLDSNDTVDMGDGADKIIIDSLTNGSTTTLATSYNVSNTETFQVAGADEASITINAAGQSGLETLSFVENADGGDDNGDTYTATGLAAGVTVQLNNVVNSRDMNTVTISLADASGSEDELTVITAGTSGHGTDNNVDDIAISDIETLSLVSANAGVALASAEVNVIDDISADTSLTTINLSGSEKTQVTLGSEMTNLATFDASTTTDNVTVVASGLSSSTTFKGGSGQDTFTFGSTLNAADTVDGGSQPETSGAVDTLSATVTGLDATTGALNVSNVEVLDLTNNGVATINAANITGAASINVFASSDTTNFTNLASGATIGLGKTGVADQVLGTIDVKLADATGSSDVINFGVNEATSATLLGTGIETANFVLSATDTDIAESTLTISSLNASTVTISGANADTTHTLGLGTLDSDTTTLDAGSYRGVLTAQASGTSTAVTLRGGSAHDVTGGAGNDTFTISTGAAQYNVDGGAGTDSLAMTVNGTVAADDIANFETSTITVSSSADAVIDLATGEYVNDSDLTTLTVTGGNGISTFTMGGAAMGAAGPGADAIGTAGGSEATGLTLIDGSGFAGGMTLTFGDGVVDTSLTIKGGAGTDTVNAAYAGSTDTVHLEGVEIFKIQADATANVDLTDTTGLQRVYVDDDGTAAATTLTDLAAGVDVYFTTGITGSSLIIDMEDATGSSDTLDVELVASTGSSTLTVTNVETLNLDVEGAFSLDLGATTMSASGATSTLNVTGDSTLTLAGTDTDIRTIDASGMTSGGSVVQTGREATGASTYTGSLGADTFIMMSPSDVLAGGGGSDTLDINYAAILGGLSVDLSSTTDQIVSWNGSATGGTVTAFENVDASGYTGSFGALLVGSSSANTLIGTANTDQISGGAGNDTITGGNGTDTITGGSGDDTFVFSTIILAANANTISDFEADDDVLRFDATTFDNYTDGGTAVIATVATVEALADDASADDEYVIVDTAANIAAMDVTAELGGEAFVAIASDTGAIYYADDGDGGDIVQIGTITAAEVADLAAGNFSFVA